MIVEAIQDVGLFGRMVYRTIRDSLLHGIDRREVTRQVVKIGFNSLPVILLTAAFTGMVLALQTAYGLQRFGAKNYVGNIVSLSLVRELGPVLTGLMLCGRVGAGIAAEISSMVVTEQVDAMRALGANPLLKLVAPRLLAAFIVVPLLVSVANVVGIYGGGLLAVFELDISAHQFSRSILLMVRFQDLLEGIFKSAAFGFLLVAIACFKGLHVRGGTEGVGATTTSAVVTGSIAILISDLILTKFLLVFSA